MPAINGSVIFGNDKLNQLVLSDWSARNFLKVFYQYITANNETDEENLFKGIFLCDPFVLMESRCLFYKIYKKHDDYNFEDCVKNYKSHAGLGVDRTIIILRNQKWHIYTEDGIFIPCDGEYTDLTGVTCL